MYMDNNDNNNLLDVQDFGQKADLCVRIREILRNYPEGSSILKELIQNSNSHTLEHLIINVSKALEKKFKIKDVKVGINKTAVAKKYGAESVSVSN